MAAVDVLAGIGRLQRGGAFGHDGLEPLEPLSSVIGHRVGQEDLAERLPPVVVQTPGIANLDVANGVAIQEVLNALHVEGRGVF